MTLTQSQIQDLYAFTRKHFVEHYDLQTELVDHLANDIEQMWQINPHLSFDEARDKAFKKFGVFGFMNAIEQRGKVMGKRYRKYLWDELKKWFELPQIVINIGLFIVFYMLFSSKYVSYFSGGIYFVVGVWCVYKSIILNRQFRKRKEISNKKWMLEEMIFKQAGYVSLVFLSQLYNVFHISEAVSGNIYLVITVSALFTLLILVNYISFELIPNKAEELLDETYPEFSL